MTTIRILPEVLSNKIAAGEVVERPASVVKELVENALDAGSSRITIEIENGGRSLIRVSDNGTGMSRDDALLSIERYATSKIYDDSDLFAIRTLGFRGEALPSIAAVSRFTLVTRQSGSDAGTEIVIEGGRIKRVSETGAPPGTMIGVKQLFFNTPARRKFLKTAQTEMNHIADAVAGIALGRPDVQFRLFNNTKPVKNWTVVENDQDRVADVLGKDIRKDLCEVACSDDSVGISGWIASPRHTRSTSKSIHIFVNGRLIRDRVVQHALFEGYRRRLVKGRYPVAVLFLTVPFDRVDVNVHPTKNEVRFAEQKKIHDAVEKAVSRALSPADRPQWSSVEKDAFARSKTIGVAEILSGFKKSHERTTYRAETLEEGVEQKSPAAQAEIWPKKNFADLKTIGQYHGTFILCESGDELILIDQHAAHERIVFEQLKKQYASENKAAQRLLVPETVELGYREAEILKRLIPEFENMGLELEPFGGNTFVVKSVPAVIADREIAPLITEIVEKTAVSGFGPGLEDTLEQCLIIMACHGTVRASQVLSETEIRHLLKQLDDCDNPSHCPHGRPTWVRWTLRSIEKQFQRIV